MKIKGAVATASLAMCISLGVSVPAGASPIYFEDFNASAFVGTSLGLTGADLTSDRWAATTYYNINNANGWTFTGGSYLAQQTGTSDGALLLNETSGGGVATTLYNLTPGQDYLLSMLLWGDNRPGEDYVLNVTIGGVPYAINGTDGTSGSNSGTPLSFYFTASTPSVLLQLSENSPAGSEASPIVDNISVTAVPEPASLLLFGTGLVGLAKLRKRRR